MLKKIYRIKKKKDFERVFKKGKGVKSRSLFLKTTKNDLSLSRFAVITSKKVSLKAVIRNKIRRQLVEEIKKVFPKIKTGYDVVVIVSPAIRKQEKEIEELFQRADLLK